MNERIKCINCITGKSVQLELTDKTIDISKYRDIPPDEEIYCGPGLTDLQVNGFAGVDFNTFPIEEESMLKAIDALINEGVTTFFPTIITNSDEAIVDLLKNLDRLCNGNPYINQCIGGIHLEGPFISPADGARGAHDSRYIKAPDWALFQKFQEASGNRIKIVTLCPEWENAQSFISNCVKNNIIVAIGHTNASSESIQCAVDSGATLSTHLGNGAPLLLPRNSSFIIEQLAQDQLYTSLIADGFHLPESFLKIALKIKQDNAILVSDSTMFAGMKSGTYHSHIGGKVVLSEEGRLSLHDDQRLLAGAALSILDGINHLLKLELASISEAWRYASTNPDRLVGLGNNTWKEEKNSDLVIFRFCKGKISVSDVIRM